MPDLLIVVPARGGSKRLPGKNLRLLGGIPLIAHTALFLAAEGMLANAIVSTDDPAIAEAARACGLSVPFLRPADLASDISTTLDVLRHAVEWQEEKNGIPDLVAVLQVTTPFRRQGLLKEAIGLLEANEATQSVVAMKSLGLSSRYVFVRDGEGMAAAIGSDAALVHAPTGALFLTRTAALLSQNTIYAEPILPILTPGVEAIDIDTEEDLLIAEAVLHAQASLAPPKK